MFLQLKATRLKFMLQKSTKSVREELIFDKSTLIKL